MKSPCLVLSPWSDLKPFSQDPKGNLCGPERNILLSLLLTSSPSSSVYYYTYCHDVCDDGVSNGALRWELVKLLELAASEPHLSGCSPSSTVVIIIMVSQDHHHHHGESSSSSSSSWWVRIIIVIHDEHQITISEVRSFGIEDVAALRNLASVVFSRSFPETWSILRSYCWQHLMYNIQSPPSINI